MGRTEADRQITNEPWSSMQALKKTNKTTPRSESRSVLKDFDRADIVRDDIVRDDCANQALRLKSGGVINNFSLFDAR